MSMKSSVWASFSDTSAAFSALNEDISVDVAVIGGGITGVTTAQLLAQEGLKVAVLERDTIGISSTGHSTGNLYPAYEELLIKTYKKFGEETVDMIIESRQEAISLIEENINRFGIDCDYRKVSWNLYSTNYTYKSKVDKALEYARKTKLQVEETNLPEMPFKTTRALRIAGAAQFNPLRYAQGLAKAVESDNCKIFEHSEVVETNQMGSDVTLMTKNGSKIKAAYVVHATHTPKGIFRLHAEMGPYREFGIACKLKGDPHPPGVYFGYFDKPEIRSTRLYERNGEQFLIVVSETEKVGGGNEKKLIENLEMFARENFKVSEVTHQWGGQHYKPADSVPYIGRNLPGSNVFVATGFTTHGLVYGTVAARLIADVIAAKENKYVDIYKPYRLTPLKSAKEVVKDNVDVFKHLVQDYVLNSRDKAFLDVPKGEGKIIKHEGHQLAVFRDEEDHLEVCSAVCTHMGCIVHWNNGEKSWDCPCHGSRFSTAGDVLEGPALKALTTLKELTGEAEQTGVMSMDELVDEASKESFPASDPPGYSSKTLVDKEEHRDR